MSPVSPVFHTAVTGLPVTLRICLKTKISSNLFSLLFWNKTWDTEDINQNKIRTLSTRNREQKFRHA